MIRWPSDFGDPSPLPRRIELLECQIPSKMPFNRRHRRTLSRARLERVRIRRWPALRPSAQTPPLSAPAHRRSRAVLQILPDTSPRVSPAQPSSTNVSDTLFNLFGPPFPRASPNLHQPGPALDRARPHPPS